MMITRIGILQKLDNITNEEFQKHWLEVHGPIASRIPNLKEYIQNHVIDSAQLGINFTRGSKNVDGFSQLWFNNSESMKQGFTNETINMLAEDEKKFINNMEVITAKQNEVIPVSSGKPLIKRMSLLKRRNDIDIETFKYEWENVHADFLKKMPEVKGYIQNHVLDNKVERRTNSSDESPSIDGIVELWFENTESLEKAFSSENGQKTMAHAKSFIGEITTFIVESKKIIPNS